MLRLVMSQYTDTDPELKIRYRDITSYVSTTLCVCWTKDMRFKYSNNEDPDFLSLNYENNFVPITIVYSVTLYSPLDMI